MWHVGQLGSGLRHSCEQEFSLALQEWEADIDRYASEYGERRAIGDEDMRAVLVTESPSAWSL